MSNALNLIESLFDCELSLVHSDFSTARQSKRNECSVGFVVDEAVKRVLAPFNVESASNRYAPYDVDAGEFFVEVKSSTSNIGDHLNVFISQPELENAKRSFETVGKDTLYLFFDASEGRQRYQDMSAIYLLGAAWYSEVRDMIEWNSRFSTNQFSQSLLVPTTERVPV